MNKLTVYPLMMASIFTGCSPVAVKQVPVYREAHKVEQKLPENGKPTIESVKGGLRVCDEDKIVGLSGYFVSKNGSSDFELIIEPGEECVTIESRLLKNVRQAQITVRDEKRNVADLTWED